MFVQWYLVLLLLKSLINGVNGDVQKCIGISLGPKNIAVASSDDIHRPTSLNATRQSVGTGEQDWLDRVTNETEPKTMITNLLSSAKNLTDRVYGEIKAFPVFALPSGLEDTRLIKEIISEEAPRIGLGDNHPLQFADARQTLFYAYELGTHAGLGVPVTGDLEDEEHPFIWLDYNQDALYVSLIDVGGHAFTTVAEQRSPELGSAQSTSTAPALTEFISGFVESATTSQPVNDFVGATTWRPYRDILSVVILSGDSSPDAFMTLKAAARQVFDPFMGFGYIRDKIDPGDVIAVGAAVRARYVLDSGDDFWFF